MQNQGPSHLSSLPMPSDLAKTPTATPHFSCVVKNLAGEDEILADPRAIRALLLLMNQHAVLGGAACHWGGSSAFAEIFSSLHALMFRSKGDECEWHQKFHFVNDAGHTENALYALRSLYAFDDLSFEDLRGFRSLESKLTGHGEAHLNPQGVLISNGPLGSGLPQAQGLAMADRWMGKERLTVCTLSDGGAMEGEAREALAAIPGLSGKEKLGPFVLIVSDNNTKLSGRIDGDSFSMRPSFAALETLGWELFTLEQGHNLSEVHQSIERAMAKAWQNPVRPQALVVQTVKGKGLAETEKSDSGGHGYPLKARDPKLLDFLCELYAGESVPAKFETWARELVDSTPARPKQASATPTEKVQLGFGRACTLAAQDGLPVVSVCADLQGSTGIAAFHKAFPERKIDIGVAEANMLSTAIGLSKSGLIPVVDTFAQFGVTKGNLPLIMAGLSQAPVIGLFSHIGFQDAADGASHQCTTYLAAVASIPHLETVVCACSREAQAYLRQALQNFADTRKKGEVPPTTLFFMGRENFPVEYHANLDYAYGKVQVLREGDAGLVVANGPMVSKALAAAEILAEQGHSLTVANNPFANRPDVQTIGELLKRNNNRLITVEDHQVIGGAGSLLAHALLTNKAQFEMRSVGNQGEFGQSAYCANHLYRARGMDEQAIVRAFFDLK